MGGAALDREAHAMTTATASAPLPSRATRPADPMGRRYGRLWARVPRELGYLALTAAIGLVELALLNGALSIGQGANLLAVLGVLVFALVLIASRYLGALELKRLRWARTPAIAAPTWERPFQGKRPLRALGDVFANGHYWLSGLHSAVVNPLLATLTFTIWSVWIGAAAVLLSVSIWGGFVPFESGAQAVRLSPDWNGGSDVLNGRAVVEVIALAISRQGDPSTIAWLTAGSTALGLLMFALFPFVTRGMTLTHWGAARLLLSRFASEDLRTDVARADAARRAAVTAEDTALRRLERDIHDGPQQRLLRLQMELATAERRLDADPAAAAESMAEARRLATETLDELRALAQGFAPPLLQDRGLAAALVALGSRTGTPVATRIALPQDLPAEIERSVYFVVAELTSNAIKHASATSIVIDARIDEQARALIVGVTDDGRGGTRSIPGHGLAGASERLAGLGGRLDTTSPEGGPTTVVASVPLP